jgi:hypothetical protein
MLEQIRPRRELFGSGPGGLDRIFAPESDSARMVTISHGLHNEPIPAAGLTVREIRSRFADRFDIDPRSVAQIDGRDVSDDVVVRAGQTIWFARHSGEKGSIK